MSHRRSPLDNITVASPCTASWEQMHGNDRVRFCDDCALHVYNLSAMSAHEAERLVERKEGRLCIRFFQRDDGTVLTQDCPRGLAAIRAAARRTTLMIGAGFAAMFLLLFGLLGAAVGMSARNNKGNLSNVQPFKALNGWLSGGTPPGGSNVQGGMKPPVTQPPAVMGDFCPPNEIVVPPDERVPLQGNLVPRQ